jgi:hypothetical protein
MTTNHTISNKTTVAAAAPAAVKTAPAAPAAPVTITLRAVCEQLKIKPRVARVALRRANAGTLKTRGVDEQRYVYVVGSAQHTADLAVLRKIGTPAAATAANKTAGTA